MELISGVSTFLKEAGDQLDNLVQSVLVEESTGNDLFTGPEYTIGSGDVSGSGPSVHRFILLLAENLEASRDLFLIRYKKEICYEMFLMTSERIEHARKIVKAVPGLDRLRFQLCPSVMSDKTFWEIYFSLVESTEAEICKLINTLNASQLRKGSSKKQRHSQRKSQTLQTNQEESMVSNLIDGARKTLRFAEKLIESVDEQASFVIRPNSTEDSNSGTSSTSNRRMPGKMHSDDEYSSVAKQALELNIKQAVNKVDEESSQESSREEEPESEDKLEADDDWARVDVKNNEVVIIADKHQESDLSDFQLV